MTYRDHRRGFQLELPDDWRQGGFLRRLISAGNPEFYGPAGSSIKFAVGSISPIPTAQDQKKTLHKIATKYGQTIESIDEIQVSGKTHATITCKAPYIGMLKSYSLIFGGTEYLITARGDFDECDSIVRTFRMN